MTRLEALDVAARAFVGEDRSRMSGTEAAESLLALTGLLDRLGGVQVELAGLVEESGMWGLDGSRSAAAWLARATKASRSAAGSDLKLARVLKGVLPLTAAAVLAGELPVGHARLMSRECTKSALMRTTLADPHVGERLLLASAHLPADDFLRVCRAWAHRADPDASDASYREDRDGFEFWLSEGSSGVIPGGLLDPVVAEMLRVALRAEIGVPSADDKRTTAQRQHDALGSVFARALSGDGFGKRHAMRPQIVVQVPLATALAKPATRGLAPPWLQDSRYPIPSFQLDRLACDSEIMRAVMSADGEVLQFGRAKRLFEGPLRRAMETRDGHCRYPGCTAPPSQSEGHHLRRWTHGGLTDLDDGCLLCWHHHTHVHAQQIRIEKVTGAGLAFHTQNGDLLDTTYPCRGPDPDPLPWPSEDPCRGPT